MMRRRFVSILTVLALCLSLCPTWTFAAEPEGGLCAHHPEHTGCGYAAPDEGQPCGHVHTDECVSETVECIYAEVPDGHVCTEESGCVTRTEDCRHAHDEDCGYVPPDPGQPCGYECRDCAREEQTAAPSADSVPAPSADNVDALPAESVLVPVTESVPAPMTESVPAPAAEGVSALADVRDVTTADEIQAAVAEANEGGEVSIRLAANVTSTNFKQCTLSKGQLTLDLNGHTLSLCKTEDNLQGIFHVTGGSLILTGGGTFENFAADSGSLGIMISMTGGSTAVEGVRLECPSGSSAFSAVSLEGGNFKIDQGAIKTNARCIEVEGGSPSVQIIGSTLESTGNDSVVLSGGSGSLTVSGGTTRVTTGSQRALIVTAASKVVIEDGSFDGTFTGQFESLLIDKEIGPGIVTLSGGTFAGISIDDQNTTGLSLGNLLKSINLETGEHWNYRINDSVEAAPGGKDLKGTIKVEKCADKFGDYADDGMGSHVKTCPSCPHKFSEPHTIDQNGYCPVCEKTINAVARVEQNGAVVGYYDSWKAAVDSLDKKTGAVRLLRSITTNDVPVIKTGMNVTLVMNEGASLSCQGSDCIRVYGGVLTLTESCRITTASTMTNAVVDVWSGQLYVTGGTYTYTGTSAAFQLTALGKAEFTGGTITTSRGQVLERKDLLKSGYGLFDAEGRLVAENLLDCVPPGTYQIKALNGLDPYSITLPTAESVTYGQSLRDSAFEGGAATVAGTFAWKDGGRKPPLGESSQEVTFTPDDPRYSPATLEVKITVNPGIPVIDDAALALEIGFGDTLTDDLLETINVTAVDGTPIDGSWAWDARGTRPEKTGTFSATFSQTSNSNYQSETSAEISVTVTPVEPGIGVEVSVGWLTRPGDKVGVTCYVRNPYDDNLTDVPAATLICTGDDGTVLPLIDGELTIPEHWTGDHIITITAATPAVEGKYTAHSVSIFEKVDGLKIDLPIMGLTAENAVYDGGAHTGFTGTPTVSESGHGGRFQYRYTGRDGTVYDSETPPTNAGGYTLTVTLEDSGRYSGEEVLRFTIGKASVTIQAKDQSAKVGDPKPEPRYEVTGLAAGDTLTTEPTLTCGADMSAAGTYPIVVEGGAVSNAGNYEIIRKNGVLTVEEPSGEAPAVSVTGISLNKSSLTLAVGGKGQLTATVSPSNASDKTVLWSTSDLAVVSVDNSGNLTARAPGTATITAKTRDGSFTATCTVTVTGESYVVTYNPNGGAGAPVIMEKISKGTSIRLPENPFQREGYAFSGWGYGGAVYEAGAAFTMPDHNVTFTAQWKPVAYAITGIVLQKNAGVPGAKVRLMLGTQEIASCDTDRDGHFTFENVPSGIYNLIAQKEGITMTVLKEITNSSAALTIRLPEGMTNSVVEIKDADTPPVVAGGLENIFQDAKLYTPEDKGIVAAGGAVEFKLTAEKQDGLPAGTVIEAPSGQTLGLFLDLSITKTVTRPDGTKDTRPVSEVGTLIETRIPLPPELQGKTSYTVYRVHNGVAEALPSGGRGERYEVSADKTAITVFSMKYSIYAIAWSNGGGTTVEPEKPSRPSGGGGGGGGGWSASAYAVTVEKSEHGKVTSNRANASGGSTVTLTVTPDSGYVLDTLTVTDSRGTEIKLTAQNGGKYSFVMPSGAVTVKATFAPLPEDVEQPCDGGADCPSRSFTDLGTVGTWYHEAVDFVLRNGLMGGYGNGLFGPDNQLTRAQLVQILYNHAGKPSISGGGFKDVPAGMWCYDAVSWAASQGIAGGYGGGIFGPNDRITREQLAVMLWRYAGSPAATEKELHFTDTDKIGGYALDAMRWATELGVVNGYRSGELLPKGLATRAQTAQMLKNFMENR